MKILVTGASGFIGKNFLLQCPIDWDIVALYNSDTTFSQWVCEKKLTHVTALKVDLSNRLEISELYKNTPYFDACLYLAANGDPAWSSKYPSDDLIKNTLMLVYLLEQVSFDRFIYFSSGAVYDGLKGDVDINTSLNPKLPYAISKLASEYYINFFASRNKIIRPSIIRFFGAYGMYEADRKIYGRLLKTFAIEKCKYFTIKGDGTNFIDAMYVEDTINAIIKVLQDNVPPPLFDLASGNPISITTLVQKTAALFNIDVEIFYEGVVPEYIEFKTIDRTFYNHYNYLPNTTLEDGLMNFYNKM